MNRSLHSATALLSLGSLVFSGCAGAHFYKDQNFQDEVAVELPYAKPYLLVAPSSEAGKPGTVQLITLPDPDPKRRVYARRKSGLGSAEFAFTLSNGALATWNEKADSKIPDFIKEIATGYKSFGEAEKALADVAKAASTNDESIVRTAPQAEALHVGLSLLKKAFSEVPADNPERLISESIGKAFSHSASVLGRDNLHTKDVKAEISDLENQAVYLRKLLTLVRERQATGLEGQLNAAAKIVDGVVEVLKSLTLAPKTPPPPFRLFAIEWTNKGVALIEVPQPQPQATP